MKRYILFTEEELTDLGKGNTIEFPYNGEVLYVMCQERYDEMLDTVVENQQCFKIGDLHIDGFDIIYLGVDQGPIVGKTLNHLLDMVIDGAIENNYAELKKEAKRYLREVHHGYFQP